MSTRFAVVLVMMATLPLAAEPRPNFTGTWKMDDLLSNVTPTGPRGIVFKIEHRDPEFLYTASGTISFNQTFSETKRSTTDGRMTAGLEKIQVAGHWEGQKLVLQYYIDGKSTIKFEFQLSADGRQMFRDVIVDNARKLHETYQRQ